jgi:hypothetical protein
LDSEVKITFPGIYKKLYIHWKARTAELSRSTDKLACPQSEFSIGLTPFNDPLETLDRLK